MLLQNSRNITPQKMWTKQNYSQTSNTKSKQLLGIINYKNIGILRNLINLEGKVLSRRITRLQSKKQRQTAKAIKSSRILGLLPFVHKVTPSQRKLRKRNIRKKSRNFVRSNTKRFQRSSRPFLGQQGRRF